MNRKLNFTFLIFALTSGSDLIAQSQRQQVRRQQPQARRSQPAASQTRNFVRQGNLPGAVRSLENNSSVAGHLSRAAILDRMGLHFVALSERVEAGYKSNSRKVLSEIGDSALALGRYDTASLLATFWINKRANSLTWPPSFRMALAAHELRLGNLLGAARWIPQRAQLMQINDPSVRLKAFTVASGILYGLNRPTQALSILGSNFSKVPNKDMGFIYLQRARIYFDVKRYSNSLDELLQLPKNSPSWFDGTIVGAWAAYHVEDFNLVLGQLMNVHSPYLRNKFRPESYLLESAALYRLCYFESANRSIKKLRDKYQPLVADLRRLQGMNGQAILTYALKFAAGETASPSSFENKNWPILMDGILGQPQVSELDQGLAQIRREEILSRSLSGATATRAQNEFRSAKQEFMNFGAGYAKNRVNRMMQEISESLEGVLSVEVEVNTRLRERLITGKSAVRKRIDFEKELQKGYEFWPFEGEFWRDETGGYAFATSNVCADNEVL
jgi:tetratricopeptide (TPR) repeat protein